MGVNPINNYLEYTKDSIEIKNQIREKLKPIFKSLCYNKPLGIKFLVSVMNRFGGPPEDHPIYRLDQEGWIGYIYGSLPKIEGENFWVFLEYFIQLIYSKDFYDDINFDYNCDKLVDDLNTIMKNNDVNLKIEGGRFIKYKPTIKKPFETPYIY